MKTLLYDIKTGDVFSTTLGWNKTEATLEESISWAMIIYEHSGGIKPYDIPNNNWEGRVLYQIPLPYETEILT